LKPISREAIPEAIRKAEHYRLLNEPEQAESICRDILRVEAEHPRALVVIVLALTDQFSGGQSPGVNMAREYASKLPSPYERHYYSGIIFERQARALVAKAHAAVYAYDAFREAMTCYEEAERVRPSGNDDALLRWNSCLRTIRRERLEPQTPDIEIQLE
jgi:hypothetical protein